MDKETFSEYVTNRYEDQINWYDRKSIENQAKYRRMQWSLIVFAALAPFLVELSILLNDCKIFERQPENFFGHLAALTAVIGILFII